MGKRPTSITVISSLMIVFGATNLLMSLLAFSQMDDPILQQVMGKVPLPIPVQLAIAVILGSVTVISGVAFLFRKGWMRYVYLAFTLAGLIYGLSLRHASVLSLSPSIAFLAVVTYFSFTPAARSWFGIQDTEVPTQGPS